MIELAKQPDNRPIPLRLLAKNQDISPKYLEQMAASLKIAGLIESVRGAEGGYRLARPAEKITVWDIYNVLDVSVDPIECQSSHCKRQAICSAGQLWLEMTKAMTQILKSRNLRQLAQTEIELIKSQHAHSAHN
ncbi:MAG: Rrf2 family transcriptional regulator [Sedimentisphaerales bacterium]|nr:Rrf2 family transcriptional regulator [Sedimentisphaerales bacterium]